MKQLIILSGKGGTGKTSLTGALSHLIAQDTSIHAPVFVDADVDAANLELLLNPEKVEKHDFSGGEIAHVTHNLCINCGQCKETCRFDAIHAGDHHYSVDPISCEGCGACVLVCPVNAIKMEPETNGEWYRSNSDYGSVFHARLFPGQENSGKLIERLKTNASKAANEAQSDLMLVDGPPGIGCPVISTITGADIAVIVTEPSVSGVHDMKRAYATLDHFSVPTLVCINKYDLNLDETGKIEQFCQENEIPIIGKLPFDAEITTAMVNAKPITAFNPRSTTSLEICAIWNTIKSYLNN